MQNETNLDTNEFTMKNNTLTQYKSLARKIASVEIVIILTLIFVWILTFYLMNVQKQHYTDRLISIQEKVLSLADDQLRAGAATGDITWPFDGIFYYLVIQDNTIVASNIDRLAGKNLTMHEAFGTFGHAAEMMKQVRFNTDGSDWIRRDKVTPKEWISWSGDREGPYITSVMSEENSLLDISGYPGYKLLLLICACIFSALLLLALIWALSWMRLSAVKGLLEGSRENQ